MAVWGWTRRGACVGARLALGASVVAVALAPGAQALGAPAPSTQAMQAEVHGLRACLTDIAPADRRLLTLRFGIGGRPHLSDAAVARRLGIGVAAVVAREPSAVASLANAHGDAACTAAQRTAASSSAGTTTAASSTAASPAPAGSQSAVASSAGGGSHGGSGAFVEALLIAVIAACLVVVAVEFRKALFWTPPRG